MANEDLPIIQKAYDLILWYIPRLNKFPRDAKFTLGDRVQATLYGFLEGLIVARYRRDKLEILESLNAALDILRYQTRLCRDFQHLDIRRYEHVSGLINEVGQELGGWIKQQRRRP
jgi:hypothetical protein